MKNGINIAYYGCYILFGGVVANFGIDIIEHTGKFLTLLAIVCAIDILSAAKQIKKAY